MKKIALSLGALSLLSACATNHSLNELKQVNPTGTEFQKELAALYLFFAEEEAEAYYWSDSQHFAQKGLMSAYGKDVVPEKPEDWDIPAGKLKELTDARSMLMEHLSGKNKTDNPEATARAAFFYDCWVEQQEEAWQEVDIAGCRESFFSALHGLQEAKVEVVQTPDVELVEKEVTTTSYMVFFELGSAKLSKDGEKIIQSIASDMEKLGTYDVLVNGHADRAGSAEANLELALKRAESVRKALVTLGVKEDVIHSFSFGESDPRVETKDGVKEKGNRRVEIFVTTE